MRKILGILASVTLLATSCTPKPPVASTASVKADSLIYIETVRTDTVKVPGEKVPFYIQAACGPTGKPVKYTTRGKTASVTIEVDKAGNISGIASCDSLEAVISAKDTFIRQLQKNSEKTIEPVVIRSPRWYDIMCRWIAFLVALWLSFKLFVQPRFSGI